ncbi:MAG: hypothetical protein FWE03_07345 [Firmicutes bacterium]|nr:hypothetical protein [Bacillota bacterium]
MSNKNKKENNQLINTTLDEIEANYNDYRATGIKLNYHKNGLHIFNIVFDSYNAFLKAVDSCFGLLQDDISCDIDYLVSYSVPHIQ